MKLIRGYGILPGWGAWLSGWTIRYEAHQAFFLRAPFFFFFNSVRWNRPSLVGSFILRTSRAANPPQQQSVWHKIVGPPKVIVQVCLSLNSCFFKLIATGLLLLVSSPIYVNAYPCYPSVRALASMFFAFFYFCPLCRPCRERAAELCGEPT